MKDLEKILDIKTSDLEPCIHCGKAPEVVKKKDDSEVALACLNFSCLYKPKTTLSMSEEDWEAAPFLEKMQNLAHNWNVLNRRISDGL